MKTTVNARLLAVLLLIPVMLHALAAGRDTAAAAADERKADRLFMEAMRQRALEREDLAYALLSRALELTPDKSGREAFEVGSRRMLMADMAGDSLAFQRAMALTDAYFAAHPADLYAGSLLARVNLQRGNVDRALEIYKILTDAKPDNTGLTAARADALLGAARFDEAEALYRRLEKNMGRNTALTQRISNIKIWKGDTVGALAEVDDLVRALPRSVDALQLGAAACLQFGQPERALGYIERAEALDPANGTTYYYASKAYRALGRTADYENAIRGAITGDDLDLEARHELLRYYLSEEMRFSPTDAPPADSVCAKFVPLFESLVRRYPHDRETRVIYMSFLVTQSRWADAAEQMGYAIDADSSNPDDFISLARLRVSAGEPYAKALEAVDAGLGHHPGAVNLYEFKSALMNRSGDPDGAVGVLRQALAIDTIAAAERADLWRNIGDALQQVAEPDSGAIADAYERALELNPDDDLAMNNYAYRLATSGGDLLRAKELIAKAVVYDPGSATYYDTYAWVLFKLGDLEGAKKYIDMALLFDRSEQENAPEQMKELLEHAAEIYERLGQPDKAADYRQRADALTDDTTTTTDD